MPSFSSRICIYRRHNKNIVDKIKILNTNVSNFRAILTLLNNFIIIYRLYIRWHERMVRATSLLYVHTLRKEFIKEYCILGTRYGRFVLYNLFSACNGLQKKKSKIPFCIMLDDLCFISMTFQGIFSLCIAQ